jgi:hypothetical protein
MGLLNIFEKLNEWKDNKNLIQGIDELFDTSQMDYGRAMREEVWFRNILYYLGEQWIDYVKSMKTFRRRILPDYIPTPVNNEIREYVRSVKSLLLQQKLITTVAPNTSEKEDIKSAELGKILLDNIHQYNDGEYLDELDKLTTGIPIFGTTFLRTFPCLDSDMWVFDKDGNPIPIGEVGTEHIIPFQVYEDTIGDRLNKKRWVGIQSLKPKEWVEDTFKVKINSSEVSSTDYLNRLHKLISNVCPWKGAVVDSSMYSVEDDSLVLFREVEFKPTQKYPNGRYVLSCGDKILKKYERMPIPVVNGKWFYSLTDFHHDYLPGSFWSEAGVSNLISPQNTLNEIDQALSINRKGVARPRLVTPVGVQIKKLDDTGGLGVGMQVLQYDPLLSGGQKPTIEQGVPLPQSVLEERAINRTAIQDIGGDPKNVLRGASPGSKASGIMVDTLRETAERGKAPDIERYIRSLSKVNKKQLIVAQEVMSEERMLKMCGKGNKWKITRFKAADLRNNTDVRMELDSGLASTNAGRTQLILDMAQKGILGDLTQNTELRDEIIRKVGLSGLTEQENVDAKRADMENAKMSTGDFQGVFVALPDQTGAVTPDSQVVSPDPFFKMDTHAIHYEVHRKFILSDEFSELPPEIQQQIVLHADAHHQQVVAEEENKVDPERDPREFLQLDKLLPVLTPKERMQVLQKYCGIVADPNPKVVGAVSADAVYKAQQDAQKANAQNATKIAVADKKEEQKDAVRREES